MPGGRNGRSGQDDDRRGEENGRREKSRSPHRANSSEGSLSIDDLKKIVADSITAQMPKVIIEASKVARENLTLDKDESAKALTAEVKKLKQSHENLTLVSEAATLKNDGMLSMLLMMFFQHHLLFMDA